MRVLSKLFGTSLAFLALCYLSIPAMAQSNIRHYQVHLTANGTTHIATSAAYVEELTVVVSVAGASSNTFTIKNLEATAKTIFSATNIAVGTTRVVSTARGNGLFLASGIDLVIATGTAPADVFMVFYQ